MSQTRRPCDGLVLQATLTNQYRLLYGLQNIIGVILCNLLRHILTSCPGINGCNFVIEKLGQAERSEHHEGDEGEAHAQKRR